MLSGAGSPIVESASAGRKPRGPHRRTQTRSRVLAAALLLCLPGLLWLSAVDTQDARAKTKPGHRSHSSQRRSCPPRRRHRAGRGQHPRAHRPAQCRRVGANPSGQPLPVGDIPGLRQVFADNFTTNARLGSWGTSCADCVVYRGDHGGRWHEYGDGWSCGPYRNCYEPSQVLSVHNGVLDFWLHNAKYADGYVGPAGANPGPILPSGSEYQTYGRYTARFKVEGASGLEQYHIAWMLYPDGQNGGEAESDYPEMDLNDSKMCAFAHWKEYPTQDFFCVCPEVWCSKNESFDLSHWHTYTQDWGPGYRSYYLDGNLLGTSTNNVYGKQERWQLQTEAHGKAGDSTSGHLLLDWVAAYER
jgi:Glycosyl hydrolases family 16